MRIVVVSLGAFIFGYGWTGFYFEKTLTLAITVVIGALLWTIGFVIMKKE